MDKKCVGCGALLQDKDSNNEGYIKNIDDNLCERCYRITNYGDYKNVIKDNNIFINILKDIDKDSLVILVMDLLNLPENLNIIKENIDNNILVVLTKRDILPKSIYEEKILAYVDRYNINYIDKIIVSSKNNYNYDLLMKKIKNYNKNKKIYVVGYTNAGKSTLINKLIYNYSDKLPLITTSMLPSTTLNSIEIKFDDDTIFVDTPGLLSDGSIDSLVGIDLLKKINPKRPIKPITYQIKTNQYIVIEDIFKLRLNNNNITLFISNALKLDRLYKDKKMNLVYSEISIKANEDLVIIGLGFIKFTKAESIKIGLLPDMKVYLRKSLI